MALTFLTLFVLVVTLVLLFMSSGVLFLVSKFFKIENSNFKKSLLVALVSGVTGVVAGIVFGVLHFGFLAYVASFFVFYYFFLRYYQTSLLKSLGVYVVFGLLTTAVSFVLVIPVRLYVFEPFVVSGAAMEPTYMSGDYLFVNKLDRNFVHGDVVVFRYPEDPTTFFIKRVIGTPSEHVEVRAGKVFINGQILDESKYYFGDTPGDTSVTLTNDQYFVLGDNRTESADSRVWGPVPKENIPGTIFFGVPGLMK